MNDKLVFWCSSCGSKLVVHKHDAKNLPRIDVQQHGEEPDVVTADCVVNFCSGTMTAYPNGADGVFADDIERVTDEFGRVIEIAYEAAREAANGKKKHG